MTLLYAVAIATVMTYFLSSIWQFLQNYRQARRSGFRMRFLPINTINPLYMGLSPVLQPLVERYLPFAYPLIRRFIYGWEFREKEAGIPFDRPGFVLVNPGKNDYWIHDPEIAHEILMRWRDFPVSNLNDVFIGFFGNNILMSNGDTWQRQRKLLAPVVNERISNRVWDETSRQAESMVMHHVETGETKGSLRALRAVSFTVLGAVGFGVTQGWQEESARPEPGHSMSFVEAIHAVVNNLIPAALMPTRVMLLPFMPDWMQELGRAKIEFPEYTNKMLAREREMLHDNITRNSVMSTLIKASDQERDPSAMHSKSLTESEIRGNMFLFTVAGFDTTAGALAYGITLLALHPELQTWIIEEVDNVAATTTESSYQAVYPRLVRCLAFLHETIRHYPSLIHIFRSVETTQSITTDQRTYILNAGSLLHINNVALQMDPATWGEDVHEFRPQRWLVPGASPSDTPALRKMPRGSFNPWSAGPRVCPGMKMAQVEFCAVLYQTFRRCRIEPALEKGETLEQARKRLRSVLSNSQPQITLQMKDPEKVQLRWVARDTQEK